MSEDKKVRFEIVKSVGVLSRSGAWRKELNIVKWGHNMAKYDIRVWNEDHTRCRKGVTLSTRELTKLKKVLEVIDSGVDR